MDLDIANPTDLQDCTRLTCLMDLFYLVACGDVDANIPVRSSEAIVRGTLNWILFGIEFGVKINRLSPTSAYYKIDHEMKQAKAMAKTKKRNHDEMEKEIVDDDEDDDDHTLARDAKKRCTLRRLSKGKSREEREELWGLLEGLDD
jgi:hypothetical protein